MSSRKKTLTLLIISYLFLASAYGTPAVKAERPPLPAEQAAWGVRAQNTATPTLTPTMTPTLTPTPTVTPP
jgi:hypothetical protein